MSRHIGCLWFTYEALAKAVGVPSDHAITAIVPPDGNDVANQRLRIIVEGPHMPRHIEGNPVMNLEAGELAVLACHQTNRRVPA